MSRIIFGGWAAGGWYWGGTDDTAVRHAVDASLESGINTFDTAPVYGFGHSEEVLGAALADHPRESFIILTKCGLRWDSSDGTRFFEVEDGPAGKPVSVYRNLRRASIVAECEASLKRLRVDTIDIYQIHWPDPSIPLDEAALAFARLRETGKIRYAGVSNFSIEMMIEWKQKSSVPLVTDQERYSLLERKMELSNLQYCRKHKIPLLAYEPLAQGLLTGTIRPDRSFPAGDYRGKKPAFAPSRREAVLKALEGVRNVAEGKGMTMGQTALAWVLGVSGVGGAMAGIRNAGQARENARAADLILTADEHRLVSDALAPARTRNQK